MRHRQGTLERIKRASGWQWYLRYTDDTGARPRLKDGRKPVALPVAKYPSQSAAMRGFEPYLRRLNATEAPHGTTFGDLLDRYEAEAMPERYSTRRGYQSMINAHIRPKWGKTPIEKVESYPVEIWLKSLPCGSRRKGHIHGLMHVLFRFGIHTKMMPLAANPMRLFTIKGATKRAKEPGTITEAQFQQLLEVLPDGPYRAMVTVAQCLGLRVSELMGLQWGDLDFLGGEVRVCRAIVNQHVGDVKTFQSRKKLPLHPRVAQAILDWRKQTQFTEPGQYIFASPWQAGELPYSATDVQSKILRVCGRKIGLDFSLGWHTFRHSYRALMRKHGVDLDIQRDLMRHADIYMTTKYGGTGIEELRPVNYEVVESLFGGKRQ